ncbi:MAG: HAMP domain-containing histidine kinase [Lachnospiraceae bacterium]|nr:HAMP domain-containing histidine kinase [Lachnospiraceae bacterium]
MIFFVMIAFVVTCNFFLFLSGMQMDEAQIREAAPITFWNIILLTVLFSVIDATRRAWMISRPVKRIREGMEKIVAGDFSIRIPYIKGENSDNEFDSIIKGLNDMTAELAGVETLRTDFISNVSHEIKTPLAVISNYATMLQSGVLTDEQRQEYARAITEQTKRLSELITNILKLNRLENQQIYPEKKRYNLSEQICECLLMHEYAWEKKELEIDTDIAEDVFVYQDAELLSLVWNNLFSNAIKFCKEEGKVSVTVQKADDRVLVAVSDTGCGISAETGKHIFEKFYQGDTSHATQGNGLGLALVKRVIDIAEGNISVQSKVGEGTTFTVSFEAEREAL